MIAADTSTWVAFLQGEYGQDVQLLDEALKERRVLMVPVVLTELLSDPNLHSSVAESLSDVPKVEMEPSFWTNAGLLRAKVLSKRRKARLGDALIAQTCLDAGILLITRDRDFQSFVEVAGLNIIVGSTN
jgi:predicted nucleic acid-binding protein